MEMQTTRLIAVALVLCLASQTVFASNVVELTPENVDEKIASGKWFIELYAMTWHSSIAIFKSINGANETFSLFASIFLVTPLGVVFARYVPVFSFIDICYNGIFRIPRLLKQIEAKADQRFVIHLKRLLVAFGATLGGICHRISGN